MESLQKETVKMYSLDEVIEILERQIDKTRIKILDKDLLDSVPDVLHYLREYKERKNALRYWSEKAISEQQNFADAYMFYKSKNEKDNNPLTWEELESMEGKPVWVEYMDDEQQTGWALIVKKPERPTFGKPKLFTFVRDGGRFYLTIAGYGKRWQAYRKERHEDAG